MCDIESLLELPYWVSLYHNGVELPKTNTRWLRIRGYAAANMRVSFLGYVILL